MTTDQVRIQNFIDSLKLSQRMFNLGLLLSFLAVFVAFNPGEASQAKIPLVGIDIDSKEKFVAISAFFFVLVGFYMSFAVKRCCSLIIKIQDQELAEAAKSYPSIVNANFFYTTVMIASLAGVWVVAIAEAYDMNALYAVILANIIITPYIHCARSSKKITPKHG